MMTQTRTRAALIVSAAALALIGGCGGTSITRHDPETTIDYSLRFDDDDARQIYREMVDDALTRPWIDNWKNEHGGARPVVIVSTIRNETDEYIDPKLVTKRVEEEILNSQMARLVASRDQQGDLREERWDTEYKDPATIKKAAMELGADLLMTGAIRGIKERSSNGRHELQFFQFELEMINLETNEKVWINTSQIKKTKDKKGLF